MYFSKYFANVLICLVFFNNHFFYGHNPHPILKLSSIQELIVTPTLSTIDLKNFISREKLQSGQIKRWGKKIKRFFHDYYNAIFHTSNEHNKKNPGIIFCENLLLLI